MFKKLIEWWTWRNAHKVTDPKLKKAMLRGIISPREALAAQKRNKHDS
jgi:hypothetical protein